MTEICPHQFSMFEFMSNMYFIEHLPPDKQADCTINLICAMPEFTDHKSLLEFEMRTPVKIERGPHAGSVGTIAGTLVDREPQRKYGLTKAIVNVGDDFHVVLIDNLRELSLQEQILLGFK